MLAHTYAHVWTRVCVPRRLDGLSGPTTGPPLLRPSRSPHLRPSRPYVHLLLPFCHPLFIRLRGTREETWPHASSHGPNNGGYAGPLPVVCPLVLRWSRAPTTQCCNSFFSPIPFFRLLLFYLFRVFSPLASFSLSRYLLPSVSTPEFRDAWPTVFKCPIVFEESN